VEKHPRPSFEVRQQPDEQPGVFVSIQPLQRLQRTPWRLVSSAATWHVTSQQHARRNALVASTALTRRRLELIDVEEFLAEHAVRAAARESAGIPAQRKVRHSA
jgi:hypothetical protein